MLFFLFQLNDWNYHIINSDKKYLFPTYEIKYDFKKSILFNTFKNITEQTHKKIDIIISTFREDIDELKEKCAKLYLDVRWAQHAPGKDFLSEVLTLADGELFFYKTVNNCVESKRYFLLEALAEDISRSVINKYDIDAVIVRVRKPNAPVSGVIDTVEVELKRKKSDYA